MMFGKTIEYYKRLNASRNYRLKWFLFAVGLWVVIDFFILFRWFIYFPAPVNKNTSYSFTQLFIWFIFSIGINSSLAGFLFYVLRKIPKYPHPLFVRFSKALILIAVIIILLVIQYFIELFFFTDTSFNDIINHGVGYLREAKWLFDGIFIKILLVLMIIFAFELSQKYTPGFFINTLLGKYDTPREEERIIMFMDLKDSTPVAEQLGHKKFFLFIREFIASLSNAALNNDGDIYQYAGDEVIVTWPKKDGFATKPTQTIIEGRQAIQKRSAYYRSHYGHVPEFRVGIHVGKVMVGKIGVVKKEIAMTGEAMNTTARIREACSEFNQKQMVSQHFFDFANPKEWQAEDFGEVSLKGIEKKDVRLYALKI